ncbi:AAA family ATPase [Solirubrobacter taibaiensis]|nr:AAA family ATPase [Solirubrobacter taibaiensis]
MTVLPGPLCLRSGFPFVGRASELAMLRSLVPWADGEGRRVALVGGEAGSGKSRLVREFATEVAERGALVLYGACDAVVHPPFGPFVEAFEHLEAQPLSPRLGERIASDPDTERHRLHTGVAGLLERLARERPVLLVIEDAHWADTPSLGLLRHLARAGGRMRVLVLATFREEELPDALAETLADLRRSDDIVRLRLGGLSTDEVEEFVRRAGGEPDELAGTINALTAGNAFLVCELWRSLADGGQLGTPESVREVVGRRVARLDAGTRDLLEVAATVGPEFGLEVVRLAAESALAPALEEAIATGMIEALPSRRLQYRFTHELVRRSLYDGLSPVRRAELHLRVGEALERAGPRSVADLAHHFAAAAPFGAVERALEYNVLAARAASAGLDFDAAAERLGVALELWVDGSAERARLLLELGTARHRAGRAVEAIAAFSEAAEIAVELGDAELLAEAAIGYEAACWRPVITDEAAVTLLERAASSLADEPSELRVGVLAGLARALSIRGSHARGATMREAAIAMAREVGDPTALAQVLVGSYWGRAVTPAEEVLAMLTEARDLAEAVGDVELYSEAMSWRVSALVGVFDLEAAHREVGLVRMTAERTAQPFQLHVAEHCGSAIALCEGRLADAETMAVRSHEWSRMLTGRDASGVYGIQMFGVRREQGRLAELAPVVRMLAGGLGGGGGAWRPGLVSLLAELGMEAEARRELAKITADGLAPFRASLWLAALSYLTDACSVLGDETTAALVYPELEPYAGSNLMIGHIVACHGAADRHLGMLAATLGEWERAESHFERALELNRGMGAATWVAHTAYEYGRALLRQGDARAAAFLGESGALAERTGMRALLARIQALGVESPAPTSPPDGLSYRELQVLGLIAEGLSNREIGTTLFISEHTAANHVRSILRKTSCANRTEAASYAHRQDLV